MVGDIPYCNYCPQIPWNDQKQQYISASQSSPTVLTVWHWAHLFLLNTYICNNGSQTYISFDFPKKRLYDVLKQLGTAIFWQALFHRRICREICWGLFSAFSFTLCVCFSLCFSISVGSQHWEAAHSEGSHNFMRIKMLDRMKWMGLGKSSWLEQVCG